MKTPNNTQPRLEKHPALVNLPSTLDRLWLYLLLAAGLLGVVSAQAASQTWTNAPVDNTWINVLNWNAQAVPGAVNSTTTSDTATFNSAIPGSGIGGAGNPITNDFQRGVRNMLFDTANCGAYVFGESLNENWLEVNNAGPSNGNITINPTVANPIVFNKAISFRGPSSQNYSYFITNNAASANATLYITAMTNNANSTSRPWSISLAGSNTGANTIGRIDDRTANTVSNNPEGAILVDVYGPGRWVFSGPNDLPQKTSASTVAHVYVDSGTLEVKDPASLGSITVGNLWVWNGGTLQIDGVTLNNNGISIYNGGTIRMNGSGTVNGVAVSTASGTSVNLATTSSGDVFTIGTAASALSGGAADSVIHISGPGTVVFGQTTSYPGRWSCDAGTNQIGNSAALGAGANLNIAAGGMLDVSPLGAVTYTLSTAALGASGTGTTVGSTAAAINANASGTVDLATGSKPVSLTFTPTSFSGDTAHPALYISQGTLSLSGNTFTVNNASGTPLGIGTYRLIQQASGNITSGGGYAVTVTGSGMATGNVGSIQVSGGYVNLVVSAYVGQNLTWTGGNPNTIWDIATDANWLNGASHSVFNNADLVTFNAVGSTNPTVTLSGTLAPGSVTADTTANTYTFAGSGAIAGGTALTKVGSGTLLVQTVNTYIGGTVISNGTLQLGVNNAIPSTGAGDVAVQSPGILDLNTYGDTINALNGNGTVDSVAGGTAVLTIGNNGDSGTFSGVIQNTLGTLGLTKTGLGTETLASANTYIGPTIINAGILRLANANALGAGASAVIITNGTLDVNDNNVALPSLAGGGTVTNSGTTGTNTLTFPGATASTYNGVISDNSPSGAAIQLVMLGTGELRLNGASTFSGGTLVASGATIGVGPGGAVGTGTIVLSNGATFFLHNQGGTSVAAGNTVAIPDNSAGTINSSQLGDGYYGTVTGSATATNLITGLVSLSGNNVQQYSSFLGRVIVQSGGEIRWGTGSTINNGGTNTTFDLEGTGFMITRGGGTVLLGALTGNGSIQNPAGAAGFGNYIVGAAGVDCAYAGTFSGSNNLVKVGSRTMTFNGVTNVFYGLDEVGNTTTNYIVTNMVVYTGSTTISNGTLALIAPNNFNGDPDGTSSTSAAFTLAGSTAVLDLSSAGYSPDGATLITNSTLTLASPQTLTGIGTIRSSVVAGSGVTVSVGFPPNTNNSPVTGLLTITNSMELGGAVNMNISTTNVPNSGEISSPTITIDSGATLVVTNIGPAFQGGEVFHLFSGPVAAAHFTSITLPAISSPLSWTNKLATDGTIVVLGSLVNLNPTNIIASFNSGTGVLTLSWPADHIGWQLQSQTNSATVGLSTNWVDVAGANTTNQVILTVDQTKGSVFFRLVSP
jgi:autotransporter-associated beta strand protein